jgi:hypothetical protein
MKKLLALIVMVAFFGVAASAQTEAKPTKSKGKKKKANGSSKGTTYSGY